jgi:stage II sporulation protein AA (anti-sigma F factor antagonist)
MEMDERESELRATVEPLRIQTERRDGGERGVVAVIRVEGEVDLANAEELAGALRAGGDGDAAGVLLDLSEVPFMDSTGLKVILIASRDLGQPLVVVSGIGSAVRRLLDLAGVADRVPSFESEDEALDAIASSTPGSAT